LDELGSDTPDYYMPPKVHPFKDTLH